MVKRSSSQVRTGYRSGGRLGTLFSYFLAFSGFIFSLVTCWHFAWHLSSHDHHLLKVINMASLSESEPVLWNLSLDVLLVFMFCIQHSLMAHFKSKNLGILQRTVYISASSFTLQILMIYWKPVLSKSLWCVNTNSSPILWWTFTLFHWLCWLAIYGGAIIMDMCELFGLKQLYYEVNGWDQPILGKSRDLQRLQSHMRHPGFTAFSLLLWCHPVMRLDRLMLALTLPLYMIIAYRVDERDHLYVKEQLTIKMSEIKQLF